MTHHPENSKNREKGKSTPFEFNHRKRNQKRDPRDEITTFKKTKLRSTLRCSCTDSEAGAEAAAEAKESIAEAI